jgi:hypothetical protein
MEVRWIWEGEYYLGGLWDLWFEIRMQMVVSLVGEKSPGLVIGHGYGMVMERI